jgi:hypothetical protein
LRCEVDKSE